MKNTPAFALQSLRQVALAAGLLISAIASAAPIQTLLDENFNSMTTGSAPTGWNLENTSGGTITVENFPSSSNKSVKLTDTSTTNAVTVSKWVTAPSGVVTVEFDIYPAQTGDFLAAGYLLDAAGLRSVRVYFNYTTAEIQVYNGSTVEVVQTYAANTWYHMKYVVNTFTSKFDVYVNGVLKKQGMGFSEAAVAVSKIQFFSGAPAGSVYFDNVTVRTGGMLKLSTNRAFEDYNSQTTGVAPSGWTLTDVTGGTATIAETPSAADKSILFNDTSATGAVILSRTITATSGKLTVEFDVKPNQTTGYLSVGNPMDSGSNLATRVVFNNATAQILAYNGAATTVVVAPYTANTWYRLKYVLNTSTSKYDVYLDGHIKCRGLSFYGTVSTVSQVRFYVSSATTGSMNVDNFNVSAEGTLQSETYGASGEPTADRIGGGEGYNRLVNSWNYYVTTASELVTALASATSGQVVYVADSADISLVGQTLPINIAGGVTLASGRGKIINGALSYGGRIHGNIAGKGFFKILGNNARVTGLIIDGEDYAIGTSSYTPAETHGIFARYLSTCEVDNNSLKGFSWAAVVMDDGYVHHNSITYNRRTGIGYGTVQVSSNTSSGLLLEGNSYAYNRHNIASTGNASNIYTAQYNYSVNYTSGHAFDMHGASSCSCAGTREVIHHNTFADASGSYQAIVIREIPTDGAYIDNNWFYNTDWALDILQRDTVAPEAYGHMYVGSNKYGTSSPTYQTGKYSTQYVP
ncbi:MAG: hypothetical protein HZA31_07265 [Opitutae bacterium]|nr:hypothetical protein [Opitutae bacterium]